MTHPHTPASKSKWWSIRARSAIAAAAASAAGVPRAAAAEIYIYGDIGDSWWDDTVSARNFVQEIDALDVAEITIRVNSYGGSVPDGIAIHSAIRRHKAHVTIVVEGMAASISSYIAMAADSLEMAEGAQLMLHAPWLTWTSGNAVQLRDQADMLDGWAESMATGYVRKSGKTTAEMLALLQDGKDHWYTAAKALEAGLIDAIVDAVPTPLPQEGAVPAAAAAFSIRFRSAPAAVLARFFPVAAATSSTPQEQHMPQSNPAATGQDPAAITPAARTEIEASARAAALAEDAQRRKDIAAQFGRAIGQGLKGALALMQQCQEDSACSLRAAGEKLLQLYSNTTEPLAGHVTVEHDETDKRIEAMSSAIMARAGVQGADGKRVVAGGDNPFRGQKMLDVARACLVRAGVRTDGVDQMRVVGMAFTQSTSDFPILLENVMHKTLQAAYAVQPDTWTRFCARGTVSDFRAHSRYRVGSLSNLEAKTELGEFRNKTIPDGEKSSVQASTKGNIINISREAVINDDLGAFVGLANALGRAAKRTVEADVYTTLALNSGAGPLLSDGKALFHVDHNNLVGSGTVISVASVDLMRQGMGSQLDVGGNDYLDITPTLLLCPLSLGGLAREVNGAEYNDDTSKQQRKPNVVRGLFRDIVDTPRLSGTAWMTFADPNVAPVIEVSFLDGNDTPFLEQQEGFSVDGTRWKVRLDYGVSGIDYRGARRNPGA